MKFPSFEFNDAVAAVCHGVAPDQTVLEIHQLLGTDTAARDEYLWQIELHARLASVRDFKLDSSPLSELADRERQMTVRIRWTATRLISAAALAGVIGLAVWWGARVAKEGEKPGVEIGQNSATPTSTSHDGEIANTNESGRSGSTMGIYLETIRFAWAENAPVLVGTGQADPLPLGAFVPYSIPGQTLHVWNWSIGNISRVFQDIRLFESQRIALSADGQLLATSQGKVIHLETGEITQIDLGDEYYSNQGDHLRRIQGLKFSPEGSRLAVLTTNIELDPPVHPLARHVVKFDEEIQILRFPSGELLSKIPPGHGIALRFVFSPRGDRMAAGTPADGLKQQIVERETDTGMIVRSYEPPVKQHAYSLTYSPNGEMLAVFDGAGALLIWNTRTGNLLHRIEAVRHESFSTALRFSPDNRSLAVNAVVKSWVIDVESGQIAATIPQSNAADFYWSADGSRLTILTGKAIYEGGGREVFNQFPAVYEWDWKSPKRIRALDSPTPPAK